MQVVSLRPPTWAVKSTRLETISEVLTHCFAKTELSWYHNHCVLPVSFDNRGGGAGRGNFELSLLNCVDNDGKHPHRYKRR